MHPGLRVEIYLWETQRRLRREAKYKLLDDPNYQSLRQAQIDRSKFVGQIFLAAAVLVGISYIFFP